VVAISIREVARVPAPVGLDRWLHDRRAALAERGEDRVDLVVGPRVVGEPYGLEPAPSGRVGADVGSEGSPAPQREDEAIEVEERDVILDDRRGCPADDIAIEPTARGRSSTPSVISVTRGSMRSSYGAGSKTTTPRWRDGGSS